MRDEPELLALLDLPLALLAGALWFGWPQLGGWPLLLVAAGMVTRLVARPRPLLRPTGMDMAVGLFGLAAGLGLAVAYDANLALPKFWAMVGGIAIYGALCRAPEEAAIGGRVARPAPLLFAVLPSFVAVYYLASADYALVIGKLALLDPIYRLLAEAQPALPLDALNSNVAGGLIAFLLPLQIVAVWRRPAAWVLLSLSLPGLVLSASRGAWLALVGVAALAAAWQMVDRRRLRSTGAAAAVALAFAIGAASAVGGLSAAPATPTPSPALAALPEKLPEVAGDNPRMFTGLGGRLTLLGHSFALAKDYAFTGLGLGGFPLAFSSYLLLVHVGHTMHSHNLLLDMWLETGIAGVVALAWLLGAALMSARAPVRAGDAGSRAWTLAALAAIAVMCAHGLLDDPVFGSRGVLVMLTPFAVLRRESVRASSPALPRPLFGWRGSAAVIIVAVAVTSVALLTPVRSQFHANLGALAQNRAELALYRWPEWNIQDELRRVPAYNVERALEQYRKALALEPGNATANRRLGQILLSLGDYPAAGTRLSEAYRSDYTNRATRQLYGEWLALADRPEEAATVLRTVDLKQGQLDARAWWYNHIGERRQAEAILAVRALLGEAAR
ncbi:MAG: O-antigen ligase family protein [Anaerolineae bacterium]|nr:O-antigen ligase family protein [Anaerolineae bacterium]